MINKADIRRTIRANVLNFLGHLSTPSQYVHILNGHMVDWQHDNEEDGKRFGELLSTLQKWCDFINFEDAVKMVLEHTEVDRPTIAFSFDDGWRDCYTQIDRKSTRLNSSHNVASRMPSSA